MDFAKKQLEKYGWSEGKGLGKNENGISEALKPKLKRSVAGIGHDPAADFTQHWWTSLYNKAAGNVEVTDKKGKTKKIKTKDKDFKITNSSYQLNKNTDPEKEEYSDFFVKTAVMTNGGSTERVREEDWESEGEKEKKDVHKLTDEELFAVCEGRTAHKGARHGLTAAGKLARIQRQEQMLLTQEKYSSYSSAKQFKNDQNLSTNSQDLEDCKHDTNKTKKKKRKRCLSNDINKAECCESIAEISPEVLAGKDVTKSKKNKKKLDKKIKNDDGTETNNFNCESSDVDEINISKGKDTLLAKKSKSPKNAVEEQCKDVPKKIKKKSR